jgi:hypothetical protein
MSPTSKTMTLQAGVPYEYWRALRALAWMRGISQADLLRSLVLTEIAECASEVTVAIEALDAKLEADREDYRRANAAQRVREGMTGTYVTGFSIGDK